MYAILHFLAILLTIRAHMILLIDAYNVLKQGDKVQYITDEQQKVFIKHLMEYARNKGHTIMVIFDGGSSWFPEEYVQGPVRVIYAGSNTTADSIIKERIPLLDPLNTLLITSDRALRKYAASYNIVSIESSLFKQYSKIQQPPASSLTILKDPSKPRKLKGHKSSSEVDDLMERASRVILYKPEDGDQKERIRNRKQLSKQEKRLAEIIKKL